MKKYVFNKYTSDYNRFYNYEKNKIVKALGSKALVEHIGSTSVRGLGGKGIVDILVGVKQKDMHKVKLKLENIGYEYRAVASVPGRIFFRRDYVSKKKIRRVHIHLVKMGGVEWRRIILFRDYLKNHPEAVMEYSKIKKQAVKTAKGDGRVYRKLKEEFIEKIVQNS
ncbi:MAG: GrpB family protein [Patescibacteria group bacterium]